MPKRTQPAMAFRVEAKALANAAAIVARRIPTRPSLPILAGVRLDFADGVLTLAAFDYDAAEEVDIDGVGELGGSALVSGRLLAALTKTFPAKPVELSVGGEALAVRCGGTINLTLPLMISEDYPALPKMPPVAGSVDGPQFAAAVLRVAPAAGREDVLPQFTGIHLVASGEKLQLLATDRYRAAETVLDWAPDGSGDLDALVPATALADVAKAMAGAEVVNIGADSGLVGFSGDGTRSVMRQVEGEFPDVAALFPAPVEHPVRVDVTELIAAVKRAEMIHEDKTPCRLDIAEHSMTVGATHETQAAIGELVECRYGGEPLELNINPGYLLDGLGALRGDLAELHIRERIRPVLLADPEDPTYRHLIVPIRK